MKMSLAVRPATATATFAGSSSTSSKPRTVIFDMYEELYPLPEEETLLVYRWIDSLHFSRLTKRAANRDFADAVMMAEVVAHYIPKLINPTYYVPTSSTPKKIANWENLNGKVFKRIGFQLTPDTISELANARPGLIEKVLKALKPTLLKGSKAILPVSRKLDNVKARFMDFQKTYLQKLERPKTADDIAVLKPPLGSGNSGRRDASSHRSGSKSTQRTSTRTASTPVEVIVIKKSSSFRVLQNIPSNDSYQQIGLEHSAGESYDMPCGPSASGSLSPTELVTKISNTKEHEVDKRPTDADNDNKAESIYPVLVSPKDSREFPVGSSWLPVDERKTGGNSQCEVKPCGDGVIQQKDETEEEIFTDYSGYDEDTDQENELKYSNGQGEDEDPVFIQATRERPTVRYLKRRMKRVVKYEYREEYILNGMAPVQLPNSSQLGNVKKNYIDNGNNDPNCRGYGFV